MDSYRLKMKIGVHEFEAEGSEETVNAQLAIFEKLVGNTASAPPMQTARESNADSAATPNGDPSIPTPTESMEAIDEMTGAIMKVENRIVSLTVPAETAEDAVLLLIYGHKLHRDSDAVTGHEIVQGLKISGQTVTHSDRILNRVARAGRIIAIGQRRGKRYRITNAGIRRAREVAKELIDTVA